MLVIRWLGLARSRVVLRSSTVPSASVTDRWYSQLLNVYRCTYPRGSVTSVCVTLPDPSSV
jgi:hypothetical protein